jgi:hypothetical protein
VEAASTLTILARGEAALQRPAAGDSINIGSMLTLYWCWCIVGAGLKENIVGNIDGNIDVSLDITRKYCYRYRTISTENILVVSLTHDFDLPKKLRLVYGRPKGISLIPDKRRLPPGAPRHSWLLTPELAHRRAISRTGVCSAVQCSAVQCSQTKAQHLTPGTRYCCEGR